MNVAAKQPKPDSPPQSCRAQQDQSTAKTVTTSLDSLYQVILNLKLSGKTKPEHFAELLDWHSESESAGKIFLSLAQIALADAHWTTVYRFAAKSLMARPKSMAAMNILCKYYRHIKDDAALNCCMENRLPRDIILNFMDSSFPEWIESTEAKDAGAIKLPTFDPTMVSLTPPKSLRTGLDPSYQHESTLPVEGYAVRVPGGRLWFDGYNIVVWDSKGRLVRDLCTGYPEVIAYKAEKLEPVRLKGKTCLLGNRGATNYYHWMNDSLPRLGILEQNRIPLNSITKFVAFGLKSSFHTQTLERVGIQASQIHRIADGHFIESDELILANYGSHDRVRHSPVRNTQSLHLSQSPWASEYLRETFLPSLPKTQDLKLYITRGASGPRGVTNESEVLDFLSTKGFQCIDPRNYTVLEQAELFSHASVVVGPHGAGLTNIVFCQPGTKVIELYGSYTAECFWILSAFSRLEHYVLSDVSTTIQNRRQARMASFPVCISELSEILDLANVG